MSVRLPLGLTLIVAGLIACYPERTNAPDTNTTTDPTPGTEKVTGTPAHLSTPHPWVGRVISLVSNLQQLPKLCIDIPWSNAVAGQDVQLHPCHQGPNQQFRIVAIPATPSQPNAEFVAFQSVSNPQLCLDFEGGTVNGGEMLQLYTCHSGVNQMFSIPRPNPGGYTSAILYSGFYRDAYNRIGFSTHLEPVGPGQVKLFQKLNWQSTAWYRYWSFWEISTNRYI